MSEFRDYITTLLSDREQSKIELAAYLKISPQSLNTILVKSNPRSITVKKISDFLKISPDEISNKLKSIKGEVVSDLYSYSTPEQSVRRIDDEINKIELPYVPAACRATFAETYTNKNMIETFTILAEPGERYDKDIIFEVNGDSMEPYYYDKMKVRARLVDASEWEYINSGVFIVAYRNHLVIKRIKNNDLMALGHLQLHSDNTTLGGSQIIPKKELQHIWKVVRIVDAPVR